MATKQSRVPAAAAKTPFSRWSRAGKVALQSSQVGGLPVLRALFDRMRLGPFLQGYVPDSRGTKMSVSQGLMVVLSNYLVSREPIYGISEWAQRHAPDLLGLTAPQVEGLNDDRVGRCLDRWFQADRASLVLAVVSHVVREFQVTLDELHQDTTTITFTGRYDGAGAIKFGKKTLVITHGYNKDHRPDLKQLLFLLTVSRDGSVPVSFRALDGNVTDDQTHRDTWDLLGQIIGRRDFLYVADSKLATQKNLTYIDGRGGRFVTVLPRTRREDREYRERMVREPVEWIDIRPELDELGLYSDKVRVARGISTTQEGYRLLWFHSRQKEELDRTSRHERMERALRELCTLEIRVTSPKTRFHQRTQVEKAVAAILQKHRAEDWIRFEIQEREQVRFRQMRPGRPTPDSSYRRLVVTRFALTYDVDHERALEEAKLDGIFPLVTNDRELSEREVLRAYKRQPLVEKRFKQLKTDFEVAPVYLKSAARVEALLCLYFFALLAQALLERELRRALKQQRLPDLPLYPEARLCARPTTRRILDVLDNLTRHELMDHGKLRTSMVTELSPLQRKLVELLGVPADGYGSSPTPGSSS